MMVFLKLSLFKYDRESTKKSVHLSSTAISEEMIEQARNGGWNGMNESEIRNFQTWSYAQLQEYLVSEGKTRDAKWVEHSLIPQMKYAMIHISRMSKKAIVKKSNMYELFGCDFILDDSLKLWLIECNSSPQMEAVSDYRTELFVKMLGDHFEVMFGLLRSRMKRVILFVNEVLDRVGYKRDFRNYKGLERIRRGYKKVMRNRMEEEFEVGKENGFEKIVDENVEGLERYAGLVPESCF